MRIAVVASSTFAPWDERGVAMTRLVGALACIADVDILEAGGPDRRVVPDGAATRHVFPASPPQSDRGHAIEVLAFGPPRSRPDCACVARARAALAAQADPSLEAELVAVQTGWSPELLEHLGDASYDLIVFVGADNASTLDGLDVVTGRAPTIVLPLAVDTPIIGMRRIATTLERADAVAVTTASEATVVRRNAPRARVEQIGTVLRVHDLAFKNEPLLFEPTPAVIVAADWWHTPPDDDLLLSVRRLNHDLRGDVIVRLVGPGWEALPDDVRAPHADSRFDVWRWVVRSLALWEPNGHRVVGREVLEALQYGTPVVTTWAGAAREHAEVGNGGLWYRSYAELLAAIEFLRDDEDTRKTLGDQGRTYARATYGDTDAYIDRVRALVTSVVN